MTTIKPIDQGSVHRLHSGQVVLDLQGAIKELVENALDAGSTSIEVRIKDNGLDSVEVVDNGSGISPEDWEYLGRKHHTSKLTDIALLASVTTFGFRGEALSSLCALCESVTVITATKDMAPMGAILKFNRDGTLKECTGRIARPRGTTVILSGLFIPLPVRRKEFERTAKREYSKALNLLYAYALVPASVSTEDGRNGVRIKVEAVGAGRSGKRSTLLSTDGRGSIRASVTSVWGPKALEGVLDIDLQVEVEIDSVMARREGLEKGQIVRVSGLISSAAWGQGRSSPDRQFIYINNRPCDLKAVTKTINEVYKSFNTNQVPLAILNFTIPPDINVSPDKRTILLHSESNFIMALRESLETFFGPSRSDFALSGASQTVKVVQQTQSLLSIPSKMDSGGKVSENTKEGDNDEDGDDKENEDYEGGTAEAAIVQVLDQGGREEEEENLCASGEDGSTDQGSDEDEGEGEIDHTHTRRSAERDIPIRRRGTGSSIQTHSQTINRGFESQSRLPSSIAIRNGRSHTSKGAEITFEGDIDSTPQRALSQQTRSRILRSLSPPRAIKRTLDTTTASWSPERRSLSARPIGTAKSGKEARIDLRNRLAKFASQAVADDASDDDIEVVQDEDEQGDEGGLKKLTGKGGEDDEDLVELQDEEEDDTMADQAISDHDLERSYRQLDDIEDRRIEVDGENEMEVDTVVDEDEDEVGEPNDTSTAPLSKSPVPSLLHRTSSEYRNEIQSTSIQGEMRIHFNLPRLKSRYGQKAQYEPRLNDLHDKLVKGVMAQSAGILNRDGIKAEQALSRVIQKSDFERMDVLGQFNKGFIIARLDSRTGSGEKNKGENEEGHGSDDLFIIDQHASDEKFNFETLQRTTVIKSQSLIKPRALDLTAGDEMTAMENLDILKANGFDVLIDEDKVPGRGERVQLTAMPVSKDTVFGFKDLEQLLHILSEGTHKQRGTIPRPTKTRNMFAMRACRKSIMIGKSLSHSQMTNLLKNMGTIDQPWNCPHGRPTMRHLFQMDSSSKCLSGDGRIDWAKWKRERERD